MISFKKDCQYFMRIAKEMTNLNIDIWVDASEGYIFNNHQMLSYIQNTYNTESYNFIPISVEEFPIVLNKKIELNINWSDFRAARKWIKEHYKQLQLLANCKISCMQFVRLLRVEQNKIINENILFNQLNEMSVLRKEDTELAFDISDFVKSI